jgi:[ribosomal protein S5]-alanine N-acetyltransferase
MNIDSFTTDRLTAHRYVEADFDDYRQMREDPQVAAWMGGQIDEAEMQRHHHDALEHWRHHGFGIWMLRTRNVDEYVGRVGLRHGTATGIDEVELLYTLMPKFWNQGLCTEASQEVLRIGFTILGLQEIVAFTMTTNIGSRRVMEKCGMKYERDFVYYNLPHALYRKTRDEG